MGILRPTRNLEYSLIEYFTTEVNAAWSDVTVGYAFPEDSATALTRPKAIICIRVSDTNYLEVEIGSQLRYREPLIIIDIFASGDTQRKDLKDFITSKLTSITYYEYIVTNGAITSKIAAGKITIKPSDIKDVLINLNVDKNSLSTQDKNRHRVTTKMKLNKVE